jgi:hypothetical protein
MKMSGRVHATPDGRALIVELDGEFVNLIQKFSHLIRKHDGDKVERDCFRGHAWSALRILRVIAMESEDDEEVGMAAEKAEIIATQISESLEVIARSGGAHSLTGQRTAGILRSLCLSSPEALLHGHAAASNASFRSSSGFGRRVSLPQGRIQVGDQFVADPTRCQGVSAACAVNTTQRP